MPWTYEQSTGNLFLNGVQVATGYSGAGMTTATGRNNPALENMPQVGPIPRGQYTIGQPRTSTHTGPVAMDLNPVGHNAHGRSAFQIHGNNRSNNASHGCIILPRHVRDTIGASTDRTLNVVQ